MTSLRRKVEYLWKTEGQPVGRLRGRHKQSQKMPDRVLAIVVHDRPFHLRVLRSTVACFIVNEIEEIIISKRR